VSSTKTIIKGGCVIAFDGRAHRQLDDGVLVFEQDRILHVGPDRAGHEGREIDARGCLVVPGFISTHAHVSAQEGGRLLIDGGRADLFRTGFLNYLPQKVGGGKAFLAEQDARASLRFGFASLVRHGITTVLPFAPGGGDGANVVVETIDEMGVRAYMAPLVTGGRYYQGAGGIIELVRDEAAGLRMLEMAESFLEQYSGALGDRLRGAVVLDEFYNSTPLLRSRSADAARRNGVRLTLHFVEQLREFFETVTGTGLTPVQLLEAEGILGPDVILAHCLYVSHHSLVNFPYVNDLEILATSGCSVAHSPLAFSRRGLALESFQRYLDAGINIALATDAYPLDMLSEMRMAAVMSKMIDKDHRSGGAMAAFNAATLGGASALGRTDLGRLMPGAKADIVLVDMTNLEIGPYVDPIRALVHLGTAAMIDTVFVDGRMLMAEKQLMVCDEREVLDAAWASSKKVWASFSEYHWAGLGIEEQFPPSIERWTGVKEQSE
jgi:cytosine/adenosine deaminase-related metal-dependent hydrolase